MKKPNFLIIGAQKAGSTWLYDVLRPHPEVYLPPRVEMCFFNRMDCEEPEAVENYLKSFKDADEKQKRIGEKTPSYFWTPNPDRSTPQPPKAHNPHIPESVKRILGEDMQMIVSMRHPIHRAISAYVHHGKRKRINPNEYLMDAANRLGILDMGFYARHLEAWKRVFGEKRILPLIFESDIAGAPQRGYKKVCDFLNIDDAFTPESLAHVTDYSLPPPNEDGVIELNVSHLQPVRPLDIKHLLEVYESDMNSLHSQLGDALHCWKEETERLREFSKLPPPDLANRKISKRKTISLNATDLTRKKLINWGAEAHPNVVKTLSSGFCFEPPVRISQTSFFGETCIGAFSYTVEGGIYATELGRYCSIAKDINIGQTNHPMDWLSSSPCHFNKSFKIATGDHFPFKQLYDEDMPTDEMSSAANLAVRRRTYIGNDVWIGHGAIIIAGVKVGDGAVIGAGSVVTKDIEPYSIVGGVPAKLIRKRFPDEIINRLLASKWWEYAPWQMRHIDFSNIAMALDAVDDMRENNVSTYTPDFVKLAK